MRVNLGFHEIATFIVTSALIALFTQVIINTRRLDKLETMDEQSNTEQNRRIEKLEARCDAYERDKRVPYP